MRGNAEAAVNNARTALKNAGYPDPRELFTGSDPRANSDPEYDGDPFDQHTLLQRLNNFEAPPCSNLTIFLVSHGDGTVPAMSSGEDRDILMGKAPNAERRTRSRGFRSWWDR